MGKEAQPRNSTGEPLVANAAASQQPPQQQISHEQFAAFQAWQLQQQQQQPQYQLQHHQQQQQQYYQSQPRSQQPRYDTDVNPTLDEGENPKFGVLVVSHTLFWVGLACSLLGPVLMYGIRHNNMTTQEMQQFSTYGIIVEAMAILFHAPALFAACFKGYPCFGKTRVKSLLPGGSVTVPGPGGLRGGPCSSRALTIGSVTMFAISVVLFFAMIYQRSTSTDY